MATPIKTDTTKEEIKVYTYKTNKDGSFDIPANDTKKPMWQRD